MPAKLPACTAPPTSTATAERLLDIVLGDECVDQLDRGLLLIAVDGFELLKTFEQTNVANGLLRFVGTLADEKRICRCMKSACERDESLGRGRAGLALDAAELAQVEANPVGELVLREPLLVPK